MCTRAIDRQLFQSLNFIIVLAFFAFSSTTSLADPSRTAALTIKVKNVQGSGPRTKDLQIDRETVYSYSKGLLEKKGFKIVATPNQAQSGAEIVIDIALMDMTHSEVPAFAVSVGTYVISDGSSKLSSTRRLAFNYGSGMVAYHGPNAVKNTQVGLSETITSWVNSTF